MSTLFIKTDGVSRQLDQDYTRYKEQEEILRQYLHIAESTASSLALEDLGAVELELRVLKIKAEKYIEEIMPQLHSMPIHTAPMDPFEDAVSAIQMYISQNQVPAFIQNIRSIHPVNQTGDVKGITGRDAALMVGEVLGVNDLYRVFTAKDPGDGHDLGFTEWLEAAGWSIIAFTPWKLAKLGKVAEAGNGLRVLDKVSEGEKSLSTMGTLSQWFNCVKSQSVEAVQRTSGQFNDLLRNLVGPQYSVDGVGAIRMEGGAVSQVEKVGSVGKDADDIRSVTKGTGKETYQHLKDYKNNKYFTRSVEYNAGKDGTGFTYKVYQRGDINWDMVRTKGAKKGRGLTNAEASAKYGLAPILDEAGSVATLHHSQQKGVGPLYEASTRYHNIANAKRAPLHPYKGKLNPFYPMDETTRGAFQKVDSINYWKIRGEEALGGR
ncbi:hypothetical protein [Peribacillus kribbensis]|uniref:hypothetical protein n=1 Tax=Peribacillus kribbensis TaxID=356658 RepID=UPI000412B073|nr:hypothetical protein [Peribacillus kribbensis]